MGAYFLGVLFAVCYRGGKVWNCVVMPHMSYKAYSELRLRGNLSFLENEKAPQNTKAEKRALRAVFFQNNIGCFQL